MACLNPSTILNPRYKKLGLYGTNDYCEKVIGIRNSILTDDYLYKPPDYYIEIPCGTCFQCLKRKRLEWSFRLLQEIQQHKESTFVTLTFDDKYLQEFKDNPKRPLMLYIDRLRKHLGYRPRYWFISELGDDVKHTGRLHFHGIFFGTSKKDFPFDVQRGKWKYGNVWLGYVNFKTANYITKYMLKFQKDYKPIMMLSNGIGLSYVSRKQLDYHLNNFDPRMYCNFLGRKYPLSSYYKTKLFCEEIRVALMLNRYNDIQPKEYSLNGFKFTDYKKYCQYRKVQYDNTLRRGTSLPVKSRRFDYCICLSANLDFFADRWDYKQQNLFINNYFIIYGKKICISESGFARGWSK